MGLFDWLKKEQSNVEIAGDRIWLTKQAKLQGISSEIVEALADPNGPVAILLVAHFSSLFRDLRAQVQQGGFDEKSVLAVKAEDLAGYSTQFADFEESQWVQIVVAERHPLPSHDESLIAFARTIACRCRIVFRVSLDEPLMKLFARDEANNLVRSLKDKVAEFLEAGSEADAPQIDHPEEPMKSFKLYRGKPAEELGEIAGELAGWLVGLGLMALMVFHGIAAGGVSL